MDISRTKSGLRINLVLITTILNLNWIFNLKSRYEKVNNFQYVSKSTRTWVYGNTTKTHNKMEIFITKLDNITIK